jgi:hypothetical protein
VFVKAEQFPAVLQPLLRTFHIDFDGPPPPSPLRLLLASLVALGGSLLADWLLVKLGVHVFPSTRGFAHFQFADYARLTIIGVVIACAGWPLCTAVTSQPAVFVLIWMHIAIAIITYNSLVRLAPAGRSTSRPRHAR